MTSRPTSIDADNPARGFHVAMQHIQQGILDGLYPADAQLPPERDLAAALGTSRGAVREAIRALQAQGLITSSTGPGRGTRISTGQGAAVGHILRMHLALGACSVADMTETRVALEMSTARLAAQHIQPRQREDLASICTRMSTALDAAQFNQLDTEFHVLIAAASGNRLANDLTSAIREAVRQPILTAEQKLSDWAEFRDTLVADHCSISAAIHDGDAALAQTLMAAHIRRSYSTLLLTS